MNALIVVGMRWLQLSAAVGFIVGNYYGILLMNG